MTRLPRWLIFLKTNNRMAMLSEIGGSSNQSVSCQASSNGAEC
jgi:hypothetical protein